MRWRRIEKENSTQPDTGGYRDWKEQIAEECFHQCVYCCISEGQFGGTRNFHVEHYRPKSRFAHLRDDISNLFYACSICNVFKSNDWPADPNSDFSNCSYADPSAVDFTEIFAERTEGRIDGNNTTARYMLERLYLNRPQLLLARRIAAISRRLGHLTAELHKLSELLRQREGNEPRELLGRIVDVLTRSFEIREQIRQLRPYEADDVRRR